MRLATILLFIVLDVHASAMRESLPVSEWKAALSKNIDVGFATWDDIYFQIEKLDSASRVAVLAQLDKWVKKGNPRLQIRTTLLHAKLARQTGQRDLKKSRDLFADALRQAYQIEDYVLAGQISLMLANTYSELNEPDQALMHYLTASELFESSGVQNSRSVAVNYYFIAWHVYHARQYEEAAEYCIKALAAHREREDIGDTLAPLYITHTWNMLGLCQMALGQHDKAFESYEQALMVANTMPERKALSAIIQGNRGDVFFAMGELDSAEALLNHDVNVSLEYKIYDNAANSMQWLARIRHLNGDQATALAMVRDAERLEQRIPNLEFRERILYAYILIFNALKKPDSLFHYMTQYQTVHDSLERRISHGRTEFLRMRMDNRDNVHNILSLNKEKSRIILIRNFAIGLIILMTIAGYLYINRINLRIRMRQQEADAKIEQARVQLTSFTERLMEKTTLVEQLQEKLHQEQSRENYIAIEELSQFTILTDKDWEEFKGIFTKVYPGFFAELRQKVPDITLAEQRMAALAQLKVPTKEAAQMLGISPNSVRKARQRLRHRLGLESDEELDNYLPEYKLK